MNQIIKHSVFIVDDDQDDRESIRDAFLENKHYQDYTFMVNGEQLIGQLTDASDHRQPSLILLDLNMPGRGGTEVLRQIKATDNLKSIPVVVITTSSSTRDRETSYRLGANCFLTKPDTFKELMAITDSIARLWL